jgi:ATP/maltotriose-dependent transcriptional regulator MalT
LLILAADVLKRTPEPARLIHRLAGVGDIEHYLMDQVDAGLTEAERAVMGALAILLGRSSTRTEIEATLGQGSVWRILVELSRRHLLSVHEGRHGTLYSQHAMVQRFYYRTLGHEERITMYRRAGAYYATQDGRMLEAAVHFARAGEHTRAAQLATEDIWGIINHGHTYALHRLLATIPSARLHPALRAAVRTAHGEVAALLGDFALARARTEQALVDGELGDSGPEHIENQARRWRLLHS